MVYYRRIFSRSASHWEDGFYEVSPSIRKKQGSLVNFYGILEPIKSYYKVKKL